MHNEYSITLIKKPICLVSSSLLIMYIIFTCNGSAGTNRSNGFSFKCTLHFLKKVAWYKPEIMKFHFIFSRKWHFFKYEADQRQVLFNILARTGVFWCYKSQMKRSGLGWTSGRYFLLKYWTASFGEWGPPDCSKVRWQQGRLGRKTRLQILGENLGPMKTRGLFGILLYHTVAEFSVGFEGSREKSTSCVLLRHFFLWTRKQKTFLKNFKK